MKKNRIRAANTHLTSSANYVIGCYVTWLENGDIDLNPEYQRPLVWEYEHKRMFIENLIAEVPVGAICIVKHRDNRNRFVEVVDGKQRLSAIFDFMNDEFNIALGDEMVYYSDLTESEKRVFENLPLSAIILHNSTYKDRLEFFYRINFAGVPQSEEHRERVAEMINVETLREINSQKV